MKRKMQCIVGAIVTFMHYVRRNAYIQNKTNIDVSRIRHKEFVWL